MITSPIRPPAPTGTGHRCHGPARPPETALRRHSRSRPQRTYGFLQTRPHGSPPATPAANVPPGRFRAAPLPHQRWIPPVRAPGQDSHLRSQRHARHTRFAYGSATKQGGRTESPAWGISMSTSEESGVSAGNRSSRAHTLHLDADGFPPPPPARSRCRRARHLTPSTDAVKPRFLPATMPD